MKLFGTILLSCLLWSCTTRETTPLSFDTISAMEVEIGTAGLQQKGAVLMFNNLPFNGYLVKYSPQGRLLSKTGYVEGKREGIAEVHDESGNQIERRYFKANKKVGFHEGWWPNGQKKFEYTFIDGLHHGEYKEWQMDGKPYKEFHHEMGFEVGSQKMWDSDGSIRANYVVKKGHRYGLVGLKNCKSVESNGEFTAVPF